MSTYDETLDALKIKLQDYFKKAETQDSQEPLSFSLLNNLRQAVDTYINQMNTICSKLKPLKQEYDNLLKELSSVYNEKEKMLEEKLKVDTSNIISKYEEKCNENAGTYGYHGTDNISIGTRNNQDKTG